MAVRRTFYRDKYNDNKVWEVVKLNGGYYLRQYVCGRQYGRGLRTTKRFIQGLGIFEFEEIEGGREEYHIDCPQNKEGDGHGEI